MPIIKYFIAITLCVSFYSPVNAMCLAMGDHYCPSTNSLSETLAILAADGNVYEKEPEDEYAPLTPNLVLNKYWKALENQSPEEKTAALQKIDKLRFIKEGWKFKRYHLAAAALIGANLNYTHSIDNDRPLAAAADQQDRELIAILLAKGADPNSKDMRFRSILSGIKKASLAKLFLENGAKITPAIIDCVTVCTYSPKLLDLYAKYGADLSFYNSNNSNILHDLGFLASDYKDNSAKLLKKASIIFGNLSKEQAYNLLTMRDALYQRLPEECIDDIANESTIALKKLFKGKRETLETIFKDK